MNQTKNGFPAGSICAIRIEAYERLLAFIDSVPEEPVSEDLEESAEKSRAPEDAWQTAREATKTLNAMNLGIKFYGNLFPYLRKRGKLPLCCKKHGRLWLYETDKIAWLVKSGKLDYKPTWK